MNFKAFLGAGAALAMSSLTAAADHHATAPESTMIVVTAEVENIDRWREGFKTHGDLFQEQGVTVAYLGTSGDDKVLAVVKTNDFDAFMRVFNDPVTAEAMANDGITGGVALYVIDDKFVP